MLDDLLRPVMPPTAWQRAHAQGRRRYVWSRAIPVIVLMYVVPFMAVSDLGIGVLLCPVVPAAIGITALGWYWDRSERAYTDAAGD